MSMNIMLLKPSKLSCNHIFTSRMDLKIMMNKQLQHLVVVIIQKIGVFGQHLRKIRQVSELFKDHASECVMQGHWNDDSDKGTSVSSSINGEGHICVELHTAAS